MAAENYFFSLLKCFYAFKTSSLIVLRKNSYHVYLKGLITIISIRIVYRIFVTSDEYSNIPVLRFVPATYVHVYAYVYVHVHALLLLYICNRMRLGMVWHQLLLYHQMDRCQGQYTHIHTHIVPTLSVLCLY